MFILVNEVVWEGEETEVKKVGSGTTNAEANTVTNTTNRLCYFLFIFIFASSHVAV